jgi:hypothetical protein
MDLRMLFSKEKCSSIKSPFLGIAWYYVVLRTPAARMTLIRVVYLLNLAGPSITSLIIPISPTWAHGWSIRYGVACLL